MCFAYIRTRLGPELGVSQQRPHLIFPSTWKVCSLTCPGSYQVCHAPTQPSLYHQERDRTERRKTYENTGREWSSVLWDLVYVSRRLIVKNVKSTHKTKTVHRGNASFPKTRPVLTPGQNVWSLGCTCIRAPLSPRALNSTFHETSAISFLRLCFRKTK